MTEPGANPFPIVGVGEAPEPRPRPSRALRILVADDNADGREAMSYFLQSEGHSVVSASDGTSALSAALEDKPDVAILDIGMPGLNGYQVAERLREAGGATPVVLIALSGLGQDEDIRRAADAGFDRHFTKPVDIPALMKLLGEVADR